jgi:hypothetical protein
LSASRRIFTICSSVNLLLRIAPPYWRACSQVSTGPKTARQVSSSVLEGMLSGFNWSENRQAGHGAYSLRGALRLISLRISNRATAPTKATKILAATP